jgi:hypothetical protein
MEADNRNVNRINAILAAVFRLNACLCLCLCLRTFLPYGEPFMHCVTEGSIMLFIQCLPVRVVGV